MAFFGCAWVCHRILGMFHSGLQKTFRKIDSDSNHATPSLMPRSTTEE
jgi:hypothetical protein